MAIIITLTWKKHQKLILKYFIFSLKSSQEKSKKITVCLFYRLNDDMIRIELISKIS